MTDRWAEVRELEGQIAARIVEQDRLLLRPWLWPRMPGLRRELRGLFADLDAAMKTAEAQRPRRMQGRRAMTVKYDPS